MKLCRQISAPVKVRVIRSWLFALFVAFGGTAFAAVDQINFVGLIPGVTTQEEFDSTLKKYPGGRKALEVGSFEIICIPTFVDDRLDKLMCLVGTERGSLIRPTTSVNLAKNSEIFRELAEGYTKKFGRPEKNIEIPVRTNSGVTYTREIMAWRDKAGNEMSLTSMTTNINEGSIVIKSSSLLSKEKNDEEEKNKSKKF